MKTRHEHPQSRNLPATLLTQLGSDAYYASVASPKQTLPRIQLVTKGLYVDRGLVKSGHYALVDDCDDISDLGAAIDLLPLACRPKALDTNGELSLCIYDETLPEFRDIAERAGEKDSGCMYGASFLVVERSTQRFCEFYLGNKSGREVVGEIRAFLPLTKADIKARSLKDEPRNAQPTTLTSRLEKKGKYSWHAPSSQRARKRSRCLKGPLKSFQSS